MTHQNELTAHEQEKQRLMHDTELEYLKFTKNLFVKVNSENQLRSLAQELLVEHIEDEDKRNELSFRQKLDLLNAVNKADNEFLGVLIPSVIKSKEKDASPPIGSPRPSNTGLTQEDSQKAKTLMTEFERLLHEEVKQIKETEK